METSGITIQELDKKDLYLVEPLWRELNTLHKNKSVHFRDDFRGFRFEKRTQKLLKMARLLILLCRDNETKRDIGYCIASINENMEGEIDSIYIKPAFRKEHLGAALMEKSLEWFAAENIQNIEILVAYGNEEVLPFYRKFGFYPRTYKLKKRK
jgi:diamine N-acetyltransferase